MKYMIVIFGCFQLILSFHLIGEENKIFNSEQDMPHLVPVENPLIGFTNFTFISMIPSEDKVNNIIESQLKKYGKVTPLKLTVKTKDGEAIDLSRLDVGPDLIYEIKNITSLEGKELNIVRASLNLASSVTIDKTKAKSTAFIWTSNCFLQGNTKKDIESLISKSLDQLLQKFEKDNPSKNKPIFYLYPS